MMMLMIVGPGTDSVSDRRAVAAAASHVRASRGPRSATSGSDRRRRTTAARRQEPPVSG